MQTWTSAASDVRDGLLADRPVAHVERAAQRDELESPARLGCSHDDRRGLDVEAILAHKARSLAAWPMSEAIPIDLAISLVGGGIVVDATPADEARSAAVER
ncbi:MAG TPA: hypothetical protein VFT55_09110, partial [Planctomycetota bacterium]|nr:hypothetical protein [Planctomycetota bacterium]